jgi:hypothetical protein
MADGSTAPAPAAATYTNENDLRNAIVAGLQAVQAIITANANLFPKALPADLFQLNTTLSVRIANLPIKVS